VPASHRPQGRLVFQGLPIVVENRKGSVRSGVDPDGRAWRTVMKHPYGYIDGSEGADGEGVDVYVGPNKQAPTAFVVHQHKPSGKGYDEDKVMLGFSGKDEARDAYLAHYDDPKFLGPMVAVTMERLKKLLGQNKPLVKISAASFLDELAHIARALNTHEVSRDRRGQEQPLSDRA
jgi:hypothetical protein